ncbi:hypothetical protein GUJ93_ZPchr0002g24571 [Zizania palustris]|uniref:RRM domain-containing protein n=1 Tax=Zizania palustris TaxID=103762 RepID=A0A8J5SDJ7_ZIZPA|nr:hypothetical protein GUJ93_ZPchr0002g24571 [Zizania palustris]
MEVTAEATREGAGAAGGEEIRRGDVVSAPAAARGLNPHAQEFVPWWRSPLADAKTALSPDAPEFVFVSEHQPRGGGVDVTADAPEEFISGRRQKGVLTADAPEFFSIRRRPPLENGTGSVTPYWSRRGSRSFSRQGNGQSSSRVQRVQKKEFVRRTIFVTDIDHTVTEDMLAELFGSCGTVVDCRVCGDPTSGLRFAFIELQDENDACAALQFDGITLGICPLRVSPSRTAIMPVNPYFLPQSEAEMEMCSRTIYCTNIHKNVTQSALKYFCQEYFGPVSRIRLLGDDNHATRIAFIEFAEAAGAVNALNSTGIFASGIPIRVCPSKTPIRTSSFPSSSLGLPGYRENGPSPLPFN